MNKKGRSNGGGQFFAVGYDFGKSPAFRSLSGSALKIFIELRLRYNPGNNGDLSLSLGEAARLLAMSKSTAQRAFDELTDKGFVFKTSPGHWYGRKAATWAVTTEKVDLPKPETHARHDWKRWIPSNEKTNRGTEAGRKAA